MFKWISQYKPIRMRILKYPTRLGSAPNVYPFINPSDIRRYIRLKGEKYPLYIRFYKTEYPFLSEKIVVYLTKLCTYIFLFGRLF